MYGIAQTNCWIGAEDCCAVRCHQTTCPLSWNLRPSHFHSGENPGIFGGTVQLGCHASANATILLVITVIREIKGVTGSKRNARQVIRDAMFSSWHFGSWPTRRRPLCHELMEALEMKIRKRPTPPRPDVRRSATAFQSTMGRKPCP